MREQSGGTGTPRSDKKLPSGSRAAWIGGAIAALVALFGQMLVGFVYNGFEALDLLQALIPSALALGGAVTQASATILALMLTLLSLSRKEIGDLEDNFFRSVEEIALLSSITLASVILLLLFLSMPLEQSKTLPVYWFQSIYYVLVVVLSGIAGLVITTVIMLYSATRSIIRAVRPNPSGERTGPPDRPE